MTVLSESSIGDHLDFLVMQPDQERAVVRDLVSAVLAFNTHSHGEPLQISFPLLRIRRSRTAACSGLACA